MDDANLLSNYWQLPAVATHNVGLLHYVGSSVTTSYAYSLVTSSYVGFVLSVGAP